MGRWYKITAEHLCALDIEADGNTLLAVLHKVGIVLCWRAGGKTANAFRRKHRSP